MTIPIFKLSFEEIIQRKRDYFQAIQPFIKIQVQIMNFQPVRYIIFDNGKMEQEICWTPGSKEVFDQAAEGIEMMRQKYLKAISPSDESN